MNFRRHNITIGFNRKVLFEKEKKKQKSLNRTLGI